MSSRHDDILLCDLDAFFASVEQLDRPELRGKPVIVGGDPQGRGVVSACSYEARGYGVRSAMPMQKAIQLCPAAVVLPVNMRRYKEMSAKVQKIFTRFTPDIEPVSVDEAYLAVKRGKGIEVGMAVRQVVRQELGLPISAGVSANKLLAKIACGQAKPDGLKALWPEDIQEALWPLSVRVLPGVGPAVEKKLAAHGIRSVGELASFHPVALEKILGSYALKLKGFAYGHDEREIIPAQDVKSVSEETTFPDDVCRRDYIFSVLIGLSEGVAYSLRSKGFYARTVSLKLRFANFDTVARDKTLPSATNNEMEIYRAVKELFELYCGKAPWRLVGIRASNLVKEKQMSFFSQVLHEEKREKISHVKDRLRNKYGREMLFSAKRLSKK